MANKIPKRAQGEVKGQGSPKKLAFQMLAARESAETRQKSRRNMVMQTNNVLIVGKRVPLPREIKSWR